MSDEVINAAKQPLIGYNEKRLGQSDRKRHPRLQV